jgi:hypothetical protein
MQEELITERIETTGANVNSIGETEDNIVQRVFGGTLWNKVIVPPLSHCSGLMLPDFLSFV